ncbi:MAG: DUF1002 domain-containing protein [Eubacteriales bacterium]|nr:DUF1002 domain-containing protein [Eubacteriales bacterium]
MRKWIGMLLMAVLLTGACLQASAAGTGVLALGANLSDSQRAEVYAQMGITAEQAATYETIYITNDMEHQYLDDSLGAAVVGTNSLSSVLLLPQESGAGLSVETHNINYCTISMYRNALLTAGVEDAKVIVAAPSPISGTAALIGAVKAYETYSGQTVSDEAFQVATDELVLTGQLSEELDSEEVSDLIAYLKQQIAENNLDDPDELEKLVRQAAEEMGITLTDEQVSQIVNLLLKLNNLDIDADQLVSQAKELYDKLESLGIEFDGEKVGNFITNFVSSIWELIQSFLSR